MERVFAYLEEHPWALAGLVTLAMLAIYLCGYSRGRLDSYLAAYASKARLESMRG